MDPDRIEEIEFQGGKAVVPQIVEIIGKAIMEGHVTPEQLKRFDEASSHPYECECDICQEWWELMPPEDDE